MGVGDSPSEFEGRMEVNSKVDKIKEFCKGAGGSPDAVVDIVEKALVTGARVCL